MTTTVEIPEELLKQVMRVAGTQSPQEAIVQAVREFVQRHDQRELMKYMGTFDDMMTSEELEAARGADAKTKL